MHSVVILYSHTDVLEKACLDTGPSTPLGGETRNLS